MTAIRQPLETLAQAAQSEPSLAPTALEQPAPPTEVTAAVPVAIEQVRAREAHARDIGETILQQGPQFAAQHWEEFSRQRWHK